MIFSNSGQVELTSCPVLRVLSPRAAYKAASEVAYLSHHAVVVISVDGGGGTPLRA